MRLHDFQLRARRRLAKWIASGKSQVASGAAYYPQQPSCQIPHLYHLFKTFLGEREEGFYVEVGAYDGLFVSNTWGLAQRGWRGVLIEPVPHLAAACRNNYRNFDGIRVLQIAVSDADGTVFLQVADTLTSANPAVVQEYADVEWARDSATSERISVECRTLHRILSEERVPQGFDVLVVDVEGFETAVFAGFKVGVWQPKMIIVELVDTHPDLQATSNQDALLGRQLCSEGYVISYKDSINTVFVREEVWKAGYGLAW